MSSIVIPACDVKPCNKDDLDNLLTSLIEFPGLVVVCFDGCHENFVKYFEKKFPFIHTLWNTGNRLNFTRNSNLGLRFAHKYANSGVFLVNQDCVLPSYEFLKEVEGPGLSTPQAIELLEGQDINKLQPEKFERETLSNKFPFYCPYFSKELLDKIGYLDGAFKVVFSDDQYILRTMLAGFPVESVNVKIVHKGSYHDTNKEGTSRSGAYGSMDLGQSFMQYRIQWQIPNDISHDMIIPWCIKNRTWSDKMFYS